MTAPDGRWRGDSGSALVLVMMAVAALSLAVGIVIALSGLQQHLRSQMAVDRAALMAVDVLQGAAPGQPCEVAQEGLKLTGFTMESCVLGSNESRVVARGSFGSLGWSVRAHAGLAGARP